LELSYLFSLAQLAEGCSHTVESVTGVVEWGHVAGSPGELGAQASENTILVVVFRGQVGNFLLRGLEGFRAGHEGYHLEHGHLADVADVAHGLKLVQMSTVVDEVQHKVVLHGDVEGLHLLG
jgi:hypothetical protein